MAYETDDGDQVVALIFEQIEALKVTYDRTRRSGMLDAYDRLVDQGQTAWLGEISENLTQHGGDAAGLTHFMINFDDGPCYELVCRSYRLEARAK